MEHYNFVNEELGIRIKELIEIQVNCQGFFLVANSTPDTSIPLFFFPRSEEEFILSGY